LNTNNQPTSSASLWQRFLWWASGATPYLLAGTPSEHKKYAAIGTSMLFIALVATCGAGFALDQTFGSMPVAIVGGLAWGALILTVDRLIQISIRKEEKKGSKAFWMALPRLLMIVVLSFLITDPLLHKFFEHEIDYQLSLETQQVADNTAAAAAARDKDDLAKLEDEIGRLTDGLEQKKAARDKRYKEWMAEGEGTGGTMKAGKGLFYREKKTAFEKAEQEYQDEKTRVEQEIALLKSRQQDLLKRQAEETARLTSDKAKARGLLARNSALFTIMRNDFGAASFAVMLMLAFILLESTPLTLKLMSQRGPYDERLASEEAAQIFAEKQRLAELIQMTEQDSKERINDSARLYALQKAARDNVAEAVLNGSSQHLHPKLAVVVDAYAEHVRDRLIELLQQRSPAPAPAPADTQDADALPPKPTPIVVRFLEPTEDSFTINFNLPEHLVKGSDLLFALSGIEGSLLPQDGGRPPISAYHAVNEAGNVIEMEKPLVTQLNGSWVVNMVLSPNTVGDG
jgi:hypothetical protein